MKKFNFNNLRFNEKGSKKVLGDLESQIMEVLWKSKDITIADVQKNLEKQGNTLSFNTVMTVMHRLVDKEIIKRTKQGRGSIYNPTLTKEDFYKNISSDLIKTIFGDDSLMSLTHFADVSDSLDKESLKRLKKFIDESLDDEK
mgnify:CR=1 FL=1